MIPTKVPTVLGWRPVWCTGAACKSMKNLAPQVKQRVFHDLEKLAKELIRNGLLKKQLYVGRAPACRSEGNCQDRANGTAEAMWTRRRRTIRNGCSLGSLVDRYRAWIAKQEIRKPFDWIFAQEDDRTKPMWDSGVRKALKLAAVDAGCDFAGFGLHSFRRANLTIRQEVGGTGIESQLIAPATVSMTGEYTKVQQELTRAILERLEKAQQDYSIKTAKENRNDQEAA